MNLRVRCRNEDGDEKENDSPMRKKCKRALWRLIAIAFCRQSSFLMAILISSPPPRYHYESDIIWHLADSPGVQCRERVWHGSCSRSKARALHVSNLTPWMLLREYLQ